MLKRYSIALLLLLFSVSAFSVTFKQNVWDSIETDVNTIEFNLTQLQTENNNLQTLLEEQQTYSAAQQIQLETYEKNLRLSDRNMKIWRSCCLVSVAILVVVLISK